MATLAAAYGRRQHDDDGPSLIHVNSDEASDGDVEVEEVKKPASTKMPARVYKFCEAWHLGGARINNLKLIKLIDNLGT